MAATEHLSRDDLASRLDVESRTITNWVKQHPDFPSRVSGRARDFPWLRCLKWYLAREIKKSAPEMVITEALARARKLAAEAEIAELNLAERRGALVPMEVHESRSEQLASRLFAALTGQTVPLLRAEFPDLPAIDLERRAEHIADGLIAACRANADEIDEAADAGELEGADASG